MKLLPYLKASIFALLVVLFVLLLIFSRQFSGNKMSVLSPSSDTEIETVQDVLDEVKQEDATVVQQPNLNPEIKDAPSSKESYILNEEDIKDIAAVAESAEPLPVNKNADLPVGSNQIAKIEQIIEQEIKYKESEKDEALKEEHPQDAQDGQRPKGMGIVSVKVMDSNDNIVKLVNSSIFTSYSVQIASFKNYNEAQKYTQNIKNSAKYQKYKILIGRKNQNDAIVYAVQVGPFDVRNEAEHFCSQLKQDKINCTVAEF
jgi:cell division septation protein DedD